MNEKTASILRQHDADPSSFTEASAGVWTGRTSGSRATDLWFALRDAFGETGLWPVIRGEPGQREDFPTDAPAILHTAARQSLPEFLAFQLGEQRTFAAEIMGLDVPEDIDAVRLAQLLDESGAFAFGGRQKSPEPWPKQPPESDAIRFAALGEPGTWHSTQAVELSLVSLSHPHEAPAYLGFGGWNDCPAPEIQVAALRDWFDRYGAVPAVMTGDVMECVVARPPQTESESLQLAAEQWLFCDDIVSQGTMSIRRLAIELWRRPQWYFWWD